MKPEYCLHCGRMITPTSTDNGTPVWIHVQNRIAACSLWATPVPKPQP